MAERDPNGIISKPGHVEQWTFFAQSDQCMNFWARDFVLDPDDNGVVTLWVDRDTIGPFNLRAIFQPSVVAEIQQRLGLRPPSGERTKKLRELLAGATPRPWKHTPGVLKHYVASTDAREDFGISLQTLHWEDGHEVPAEANARLIATMRNELPELLDDLDASQAEVERLRRERDEARAENYAIRLRTCDAHAAVYRAMRAPTDEAIAALGDEGYVHQAVHAILCGADGTSAYPVDEALRLHIEALGERALRAEHERDEAMAESERLRQGCRLTAAACDQARMQRDQAAAERDGLRTRSGWADGCIAKLKAELARVEAAAQAIAERAAAFDGEPDERWVDVELRVSELRALRSALGGTDG